MSNRSPLSPPPRAVIAWMALIVAMIAAIVLVGGMTRLTDSGLSITEWKPVTGVFPPLSDADWQAEFAKYQGTTEYQVQNLHFTLAEFQTIYWWEWGHRLLARAIGLVVLVPLLWFWWRGMLTARERNRGFVIFALVCVQGLIGWLMVVSGLTGQLDVSQYRLAAHLGAAFLIFAYAVWVLLDLLRGAKERSRIPGRGLAVAFLIAVFIQVLLGALVAGLDAGLTFNTWPLMDGRLIPSGLLIQEPWWRNFGENVATVQFQHRMMGYLVALMALALAARSVRTEAGQGTAGLIVALTLGQIALGVFTLLAGADGEQPVLLGTVHQLGALALLGAATVHLHRLSGPSWRLSPTTGLGSPATLPG